MAEVQQAAVMLAPVKPSHQTTVALAAAAGTSIESAPATGKIVLTDTPKLAVEPAAFFPANPAAAVELAQNKPVKGLAGSDRTASGGLLRTISDVIGELRQKHQDRKRVRAFTLFSDLMYVPHWQSNVL